MAKDTVYYGQLERFGYTLTAIGRTEREVRKALEKEYVETYISENGADPREEFWDDGESYYKVAMDEMYIDEFTFGKVEWL